jgi:hypothetical protein
MISARALRSSADRGILPHLQAAIFCAGVKGSWLSSSVSISLSYLFSTTNDPNGVSKLRPRNPRRINNLQTRTKWRTGFLAFSPPPRPRNPGPPWACPRIPLDPPGPRPVIGPNYALIALECVVWASARAPATPVLLLPPALGGRRAPSGAARCAQSGMALRAWLSRAGAPRCTGPCLPTLYT